MCASRGPFVCVCVCLLVWVCFYFPPFEHCKLSAEQREGLAHELRDLGGVGGAFSHTQALEHTHTHTHMDADAYAWQWACQRWMLMLLQQLLQDWKCVRTDLSASPAQICTCVGDFSCQGLTQELAGGIQEKLNCHWLRVRFHAAEGTLM